MERLEIEILASVDGLEKSLSSAQTKLQDFGKSTEKLGGTLSDLSKPIEKLNTTSNQAFTTIQQGSLKSSEALKLQRAQLQALADLSYKPEKLVAFNQQIEQLSVEIKKMSNAGKTGFNDLGEAIGKNTNYLTKGFSAVRQLAYILPGIGIAGILAFATEPIINFISTLDIFKEKITLISETQNEFNKALAGTEYAKAVSSVTELTENFALARAGVLSKKEVLKEYNDTLGKTIGKTNDFNIAESLTLDKGGKVIQLILLKAAAQLALADATKKTYERATIANKSDEESATFVDKYLSSLAMQGQGQNYGAIVKQAGAERKKINLDQADKDIADFKSIFKTVQDQAANFAKDNKLDFFGGTEDPKKVVDPLVKQAAKIKEVYIDLANNLNKTDLKFGEIDFKKDEIKDYQKAINDLIDLGLKPESKAIQDLIDKQKALNFIPLPDTKRAGFGETNSKLPEVKTFEIPRPPVEFITGAAQYIEFMDKLNADFTKLSQTILQSGIQDAFKTLGTSIGESLANGANLMQTLGGELLGVVGKIATQLGEAAVGIGIAMLGIKAAFSNPLTAIAAGIALIALGSFISSKVANITSGNDGKTSNQTVPIRQFASGGIISGPTLGLMGEYAGASSNPEVVAPLNKLKGLLSTNDNYVNIPDMQLRGEDIFISFKRVAKRLGGLT